MRINLYGGPGSGKSTTAAWLFSELKKRHFSIELIPEYVKSWAYQNRKINQFDQIYFLGKQLQYEYRFLSSGVKNVITDCPVLLSAVYAKLYYPKLQLEEEIINIVKKYETEFPSLNIFLMRGDKKYHQQGRYQTLEEAKEIDYRISLMIGDIYSNDKNLFYIPYSGQEKILNTVLDHI